MEQEISFGVWLRKKRRSFDLTRQAFADQVGCAEVTLRRIEAGTLKPSKELASILLEHLDVPETDWPQWISFARGTSGLPLQSIPSSNKTSTNLPAPLTTFIGREKEQSDILRLLSQHRLLTLTGPGGVGKTRLAIKVVSGMAKDFPDGVWFLDLAPLSDPELAPTSLARLLELRELKESSVTNLVINYLRSRTVLVIFDNCEHLIEASARFVHALLTACPHLTVLATSREVLRVAGEVNYHVPPLDFPPLHMELALDEISAMDSVRLFIERAAAVSPGLIINERNAPIIANICRGLDGIPLAIELAAAHAKILGVEQLLKRLDDRFRLLRSGSRTVLPRQQTLLATIEWSYDLLTDPEQRLFRRLPVFVGGFGLEAAEAICGRHGLQPNEILDLLERLVDKSLVNVEHIATTEDARYRLLETIREYLFVRLQESNETLLFRDAHLEYFTKFAKDVGPKLFGYEQALWFSKINVEMDNLQAALDWSTNAVVQPVSDSPNDRTSKLRQQLDLCKQLGEVLNAQAKYNEARDVYEVMLKSAHEADDLVAQSQALLGVAISLEYQGDNSACLDFARQAEILAHRADHRSVLASALRIQGVARYRLGDLQAASDLGEQSFSLAVEVKDRNETARSLNLLGAAAYLMGKYDAAKIYWQIALSIFQELGNLRFGMDITSNLGVIADAQGDYESAFRYYQDAWEIAHRVGYRDGEIVFLCNKGGAQMALKDYVSAEADLRTSIQMAGTVGSWCLPSAYAYLAETYLGQGKLEQALHTAQLALEFAQDGDTPEYIGVAWRVLGMISERMRGPIIVESARHKARDCFKISEKIFAEAEIHGERARTLREWAGYELRLGHKEYGVRMWEEARRIFEELGARWEVERMTDIS